MDSLLEKKLENPRMSLEGKLERLNTTYGMKTAYKILTDLCLCAFLTIINQINFRCCLHFIKAWPKSRFTSGIYIISYSLPQSSHIVLIVCFILLFWVFNKHLYMHDQVK